MTACLVFVQNMSTTCDEAASHKGEKKRSFTMSQKCEAIDYAEKESNRAAAKKCKGPFIRAFTVFSGAIDRSENR